MRLRSAPPLLLLLILSTCDTLSRSVSKSTPSSQERGLASTLVADTSRAEIRFLRRYGWTPVRLLSEDTLHLPAPVTRYLQTKRYLEASQMVGLYFSSQAGHALRVLTYGVHGRSARPGSVRAHLLYADAEVVGAWLSVEDRTPGIYPLSFDPYSL